MAQKQPLIGRNITTVKSHNLHTILLALLRHQHVSRVDLAKMTGLSTTTITNLISELLEQGIVVEEGTTRLKRRAGAGRPRMALRLEPEAKLTLGVHIGVGQIRIALTDLRANMLDIESFTHPLDKTAQDVMDEIVEQTQAIIRQNEIAPQDIIGVGVGASGLVDTENGINVMAPNLGWSNIPVRDYLSRRLGLPVVVDNNVRAMALGEALFGSAQKVRVLAFVYARYGVGSGIVVDGQIYRGVGAGAGEIGHTTITLEGGELCRCGNRGCLEPLVSEPAIMALAQKLAQACPNGLLAAQLRAAAEPSIEQVFTAARMGDEATQTLLNERARYMGIALANLVNVLNPELILLGGLFSQGQDLLLRPTEVTMRQRSFGELGAQVKVRATSFGKHAGAIGAAALALTTFFYHQQTQLQANLAPEVIL